MLKFAIVAAIAFSVSACAPLKANRATHENKPIIARAIFSDRVCPNDPDRGRSESVLSAAAASLLIGKAAEASVNYLNEAIIEAAKQDSQTFTITGQNPDYLFTAQDGKTRMRGCLFVIVAPRVTSGQWCEKDQVGNWYNRITCREPAPELKDKWEEWSLGTPVFFAEIGMVSPPGGPTNTVIPRAYKVYYPEPISTMAVDKVKGFTISVTASKPTKSTKSSGDVVLEVFLGGDGVTPRTVTNDATALQTSGLWVNVPSAEGTIGSKYAGPVNLSVTVAETPHPTKWLQALATYSGENKQKAIDAIVAKVDPAAREQEEEAEIIDSLTLDGAASTACVNFSQQMAALASAQQDVKSGKGSTYEEKLQYGYALDAACTTTKLLKRTTLASWEASSKSQSGHLCGRAQDADVEITTLCSH